MRQWLSFLDHEPAALVELATLARRIKAGSADWATSAIRGRTLIMLFFNSSLRTRTSFEAAMLRFGGHAICLNVGGDTWKLEHRDGVVMDGDAAEHIREAAPVLGRYGDALAVRTFAEMKDAALDASEPVLRGFAAHARVPVVNMESAFEHPCQGLADMVTLDEKLGGTAGKRFVLTWAPHIKPLPMAVPNSALLAAAAAGMHVTVAHPPGYELHPAIVDRAASWCAAAGTKLEISHDQLAATRSADAVYVKSWGAAGLYGDATAQRTSFQENRRWMVTREHLGESAIAMHCLPVRRNVVMADSALDDPRCVVVDQAENRLWAQAAVLGWIWQERR